ncbi:MAG: hypothetical protein GXO69_02480 [Acidobacteria bacterium]|nr:hypothetical protein [Acidobacteriota bacterium]
MKVYRITQFITRWGLRPEQAISQAAGKYRVDEEKITIRRQALDVRGKRPRAVYTMEVPVENGTAHLNGQPKVLEIEQPDFRETLEKVPANRIENPVIAGLGPAGLFAALTFLEKGVKPVILERGKPVEERVRDVNALWNRGELNEDSNPLFGEGGAGTFSDGKLTTRINDPMCGFVLEQLVRFGARDRILTDAKPHVGTDKLIKVLAAVREYLLSGGAEIHFNTRFTGFRENNKQVLVQTADGKTLTGDCLILAIGHSARDTYRLLMESGMAMEPKPFAVGARIEHPQGLIDDIMYGKGNRNRFGLPPAAYQMAWNGENDSGCYTFCMCPGGEIILAVNEPETLCVNGMSSSKRNSPFANAALVAKVPVSAFNGGGPLAGVRFQRQIEQDAYRLGMPGFMAPAQRAVDFLDGRMTVEPMATSFTGHTYPYPLHELLPDFVVNQMRAGLRAFNHRVRGFADPSANLVGVETRTSAPLRILRDKENRRSLSHKRIFPCGEGAGYAGGIMSAAVDGIKTAIAVLRQ